MAKIIEIAGPAGAGKSTILNSLAQGRKESSEWIFYQKLLPYQKINYLKLSNVVQNLPSLLKKGKGNLDDSALYEAGKRFIMAHESYVDLYWQNLHTNYSRDLNGFDARFDSSAKFYNKIKEYQYIEESKTSKRVLFEEGLIHNLTGRVPIVNGSLQKEKSDIDAFLMVMPLPESLIVIDTDAMIIIERLVKRKKVLPMHRNKSVQELRDLTMIIKERMAYAIEVLLKNGVNVLSIDSQEEVRKNTDKINAFVNQTN